MTENFKMITHGSEDSLDKDVYVLVNNPLEHKAAKHLCDSFKEINANLIYIENNKVAWVYKGTTDEVHNSIINTFHLHEQTIANPIIESTQRFHGFKAIRTVRGLLSTTSRTQYREIVKKALITPDINFKLETLKKIKISTIEDFEKNNKVEVYKFFAFQLGQTLSLIQDNEELFTKKTVAKKYPDLEPFLYRKENTDTTILDKYISFFIEHCEKHFKQSLVPNQCTYTYSNNTQEIETLDLKNEKIMKKVIVCDLDGTLFDESHRAHFRQKEKWDLYFDACDKDPLFQQTADIIKKHKEEGFEIWMVSGRLESCLEKTKQALKDNNVPYDHLKLRSQGNRIPDYVIKPSWMEKLIGVERIHVAYEDQDRVMEGLKKKNIPFFDIKTILQKTKTIKHK